MCGTEKELFECKIEGTYLNVCEICAQHGTIKKKVSEQPTKKDKNKLINEQKVELIQMIVPNYATIIKDKREELGLKQEEFAKRIAEKESVIHKLESGKIRPSISLARKLEKFLKIELVKQYEEKHESIHQTKTEGLTIGDLLNQGK